MKGKNLFLGGLLTVLTFTYGCSSENSNGSSSSTYSDSTPECKPSTSKVRSLVRSNWNAIQSTADFTISDKKSFEINDYGMDGDELTVDVYSRGYRYDIEFTVSFEAYFDDDCSIEGDVTDVYNYKEK